MNCVLSHLGTLLTTATVLLAVAPDAYSQTPAHYEWRGSYCNYVTPPGAVLDGNASWSYCPRGHYEWKGSYCQYHTPDHAILDGNASWSYCPKGHYEWRGSYCAYVTPGGATLEGNTSWSNCNNAGVSPGSSPTAASEAPKIAMHKGDAYGWTKDRNNLPSAPVESVEALDLVSVLRNAGAQVSATYKQAIQDAATVRPAAGEGSEDQEKIDILVKALGQGVANLNPNNKTVIPATHWRARETARMIVVMSQIVSGVFQDFSGVSQTSDPDPVQRAKVTAFQQALARMRGSIEFLKSAYGLKGFAGEPSKASVPLVKVAEAQLLQLARALSFDKNPTNDRPKYQTTIENMQAALAQIGAAAESRGDSDRSLKGLVDGLSRTWNDPSPGGAQELIQRSLKAGGEFATDAQLLYLTLSSLGNIHGQARFQMPGVTTASNTK